MTPLDPLPPLAYETLLLAAAAIGLRLAGLRWRAADRVPARWLGWTASSFAPWLGASLFGGWSPLWVALVGGLACVTPARLARRRILAPLVDGSVLLLAFGLSVGGPPTAAAALAGVLVLACLTLFDDVLRALGERPPLPVAVLGLLPALGFTFHVTRFPQDPLVPVRRIALRVGLVPRCFGVPVSFADGGRGWLDLPGPGSGRVGAVFFHGADSRGARQPAACAIRRALQESGMPVLSLDHTGYGQSAAPAVDAQVDAWDYLPAARTAATWLVEQGLADRVVLVGHSMGTASVLRLAADPPPGVVGGILLGAAYGEKSDPSDYWYERFHRDRGIEGRIDREKWLEIGARYYDLRGTVASLRAGALPLADGMFVVDWPNIRDGREALYEELPEPKSRFFVPSSHYFSSYLTTQLLVGDPHAARVFAGNVDRLVGEAAASGTRAR